MRTRRDDLTDEGREAIREAARRQYRTCPKCGGTQVEDRMGDPKAEDEFPEVKYRVCNGCGNKAVVRKGRAR